MFSNDIFQFERESYFITFITWNSKEKNLG